MQLTEVAFRYRRRGPWVLHGVSLAVPPGHVLEVTGRNGAGKSTLLRVLAGLRSPGRGTVTGRPDRVGYAPERFPVDQPFTVASYLKHMAAVRGLRDVRDGIDRWADRLRAGHLMDTRLPELSKGGAQKVGLVQALLADPGLLVLDEPFAGLDAETRAMLPGLIAELAAEGTAVVVSDHQRVIESVPGVDRVRVENATVSPVTSAEWAVLEVTVRADEADSVESRLRADGHEVRRRGAGR
ncbi:ABC transporter ATP-binding protein [Spirillospora sp. NPDC047279]|uniref:ABC transporter ATP-binding protein n=1 Tax=Spirillospora sp. NPDC047279 TaxID=3155478 RepID=UPI0033FB6147